MKESVVRSIPLVAGTMPLLMRGAAVSVALGLGAIPYFLVCARLAPSVAGIGPGSVSAFLVLSALLLWLLFRLFRRRVLLRVRTAQVAMITEIMRTEKRPASGGQFRRGTELIENRFGPAPRALAFHARLERFIRTTGRTIRMGGALPVACILKSAFLAELILAFLLFQTGSDPRQAAHEALNRLFGRGGGRFMGRAIPLLAVSTAFYSLLLFLLMLPIFFLFRPFGVPLLSGFLLTLILAWTAHQAFVHPLVMTALIVEFIRFPPEGDIDPAVWKKFESFFPEFTGTNGRKT